MRFKILAIALLLAVGAMLTGAVVTHADDIYVRPSSGSQYDTFTFHGEGFFPGERLDVSFVSPDGETFTYYLDNGDPAVLVVGDDGTFDLQITPAFDFAGAEAGTWSVQFCSEDSGDCYSGTINISLF